MAGAQLSVNEIEMGLKTMLLSPKQTDESNSSCVVSGKKKPKKAIYQPSQRRDKRRDSPISEDTSVISYETSMSPIQASHGTHRSSCKPTNNPGDLANSLQPTQKKRPKKKKKKADKQEDREVGNKKDTVTKQEDKIVNTRKQNVKQQRDDKTSVKGKEEVSHIENLEAVDNFVQCQNELFRKDLVDKYEAEYIYLLRKKSLKFPTAKFFCRLCDYHCFDFDHCEKHTKDTRHHRLKKTRLVDQLLRSLPPPEPPHIECVTNLIEHIYADQGLTEADLRHREEVIKKVEMILTEIDPDQVNLIMYGSSHSGLGIKSSDVNIDFATDVEPYFLKDAHLELKENQAIETGYVAQVESDFSAKVPIVRFTVPSVGVSCQLGINNTNSHQTSALLNTYSKIDHRFKKLAVAFRYLGKLCQIASQGEGTLPSYVLSLMTAFYLQQCKPPVLPILHEIEKPQSKNPVMENWYFKDLDRLSDHWKCKNHSSVGQLWIQMLRFYSVDFDYNVHVISLRQLKLLNRQEKKWASKKLAIEDPFMRRWNVARSVSHSQVFEYITERIRAAYQYFGIPRSRDGPLFADIHSLELHLKHIKSKQEVGNMDMNVQNAKGNCAAVHEEVMMKKIAGEVVQKALEMGIKKALLLESGSSSSLSRKNTDPPCTNSNVVVIDSHVITTNCSQDSSTKSIGTPTQTVQNEKVHSPIHSDVQTVNKSTVGKKEVGEKCHTNTAYDGTDIDGDSSDESKSPESNKLKTLSSVGEHTSSQLVLEDMLFSFDAKTLSDSKGPAIMCSICQQEGHLKSVCPEENLSPPPPLPPLTKEYVAKLNQLLINVPKDFEPTPRELEMRQNVVYELEEAIKRTFPDAKLQLFGSSCNGFGFRGSDLDLCLTFEDEKSPELLDSVKVIELLTKVLKKLRTLYHVFPITTAKVPIVKFRHRQSQLEGDISLYNTLAIQNTRMLLLYSEFDYRVKHLGYTMKVFAKICDICDASRGSLSSYAYILLVIYFLQQRNPPVIPVLQELQLKKEKKNEHIIDGWNASYFDDLSKIHHVWPHRNKNKETLADLWIGLLRFYTEDFNFKDYVVSIRQKKPLTKFEKLWNNKTIAIQDPFDLGHNLGGGLSRKMNMFIIRTLRNGRLIFGTSIHYMPNGYKSIQDYLFDPNILTDSLPPSDRNCHRCGKIGHYVKECPLSDGRKDRQEQSPDKDQEQGIPQKGRRSSDTRGRATPERSRSASQAIPQHHPHLYDRQMSNTSEYTRSRKTTQQEYHGSKSTPEMMQPLMAVNTPYQGTPPDNWQQHQPQAVFEGSVTQGSPFQRRTLLPDPHFQQHFGTSPTGYNPQPYNNSPTMQYQQQYSNSPNRNNQLQYANSPTRHNPPQYGNSPTGQFQHHFGNSPTGQFQHQFGNSPTGQFQNHFGNSSTGQFQHQFGNSPTGQFQQHFGTSFAMSHTMRLPQNLQAGPNVANEEVSPKLLLQMMNQSPGKQSGNQELIHAGNQPTNQQSQQQSKHPGSQQPANMTQSASRPIPIHQLNQVALQYGGNSRQQHRDHFEEDWPSLPDQEDHNQRHHNTGNLRKTGSKKDNQKSGSARHKNYCYERKGPDSRASDNNAADDEMRGKHAGASNAHRSQSKSSRR